MARLIEGKIPFGKEVCRCVCVEGGGSTIEVLENASNYFDTSYLYPTVI